MNRDNGGFAFPRQLPDVEVTPDRALEMIEEYGGLTIRDYFAGQALVGMLANSTVEVTSTNDTPGEVVVVKICYLFADTMLAERGKK